MPYLKLWHGHRHPNEQLDGWGEDGPTFGPFPFFHMTYGCDIKFGDDGYCLNLVQEFVYYDGMYYGDWSFCDQLDEGMRSGLVSFDPAKAVRADCQSGNLQPCVTSDAGGISFKGTDIVDPNAAWLELMDAFRQLDWNRVHELAEGLLQWMVRDGFPPETSVRNSTKGVVADALWSLGSEWNRTVAQAACRYALDLANQVLQDPNGIPHGVPFTLSCCKCDVDGSGDYYQAVDAGWFRIRFVPQNVGENFIGLCPNCE